MNSAPEINTFSLGVGISPIKDIRTFSNSRRVVTLGDLVVLNHHYFLFGVSIECF